MTHKKLLEDLMFSTNLGVPTFWEILEECHREIVSVPFVKSDYEKGLRSIVLGAIASIKTPSKARASAENGKKGGRPRIKQSSQI